MCSTVRFSPAHWHTSTFGTGESLLLCRRKSASSPRVAAVHGVQRYQEMHIRAGLAYVCPKCKQLQQQLRYWRERDWMQKARDDVWIKMRSQRQGIPVNTSSGWNSGMLVETHADAPLPTSTGFEMRRASSAVPHMGPKAALHVCSAAVGRTAIGNLASMALDNPRASMGLLRPLEEIASCASSCRP
jgi:hypothetical protein